MPSAMDIYWLEAARGMAKESIPALEEASKQLITVTSLVQGIYFAAISFSDLKAALVVQDMQCLLLAMLFISPVIFWLVSLAFAVQVFKPETHQTSLSSPDLARDLIRDVVPASFPDLAIKDEGRLRNINIRDHFLTRLYTLASFREVLNSGFLDRLIHFQTANKLLLMLYNQKETKVLGNIVANQEKLDFARQSRLYREHLANALKSPPRFTSNLNSGLLNNHVSLDRNSNLHLFEDSSLFF